MAQIRRLLSLLLAAVIVATTFAVTAGPPATVSAAPPPASFRWSMPERFGADANGDHVIDEINLKSDPAFVRPSSWPVDFDACQTGGAPLAGASYTWTVAGVAKAPTASCTMTHQFDAVDTAYAIGLTVTVNGESTTTAETIVPRDYVIVSMGDSGASGEGNPDYLHADFTAGGFGKIVFQPRWNDLQCHRSALAGPAQAALRLEQRDPHSSVTFVHVACSGARITRGILGTYQGLIPAEESKRLDCDNPNLANPSKPGQFLYIRQPDPAYDAPTPTDTDCLPSQIDQVRTILGSRPIDVVNVLAGVNDVSFSKVAMSCLADDDCSTVRSSYLRDPDNRLQTAAEFLEPRFTQLPDRYAALADALMDPQRVTLRAADPAAAIPAGHVFLGEYPDPSKSDDMSTCSSSELGGAISQLPPEIQEQVRKYTFGKGDITSTEWGWAAQAIIGRLRESRDVAVGAANVKYPGRFSAATGSTDTFHGHGYCAEDKWFRSVGESFLYQRDQEGSLHPNRAGHFYGFALPLEAAWATQLGITAPALPPHVPGNIESFEALHQGLAPLFDVLSRTDIAAELDRLFPIRPGYSPDTPGPGALYYFRKGVTFVATSIGEAVAAEGLSALDTKLDDLDGVNGTEHDGQFGPLVLDVQGKVSPHDLSDKYEVVVDMSLVGNFGPLDLSTAGLSLTGPDTQVAISTRLRFLVDTTRPREKVYLDVDDEPGIRFTVRAQQTIDPANPLSAQLGPIGVTVAGPDAGSPPIDLRTSLELRPRDTDGDGEITSDELVNGSFAGSFDTVCDPTSRVDIDLRMAAGITGLAGAVASLGLHDSNVCDGVADPELDFATPDLAALGTLGPEQVIEAITALAQTLERMQASGDVDLPFTDAQLGDAVELAGAIRRVVASPETHADNSLQAVLGRLETELGLPAGSIALSYDAPSRQLRWNLHAAAGADDVQLPVDLGLLERAGIVDNGSTAKVVVSADASADLSVALDLTAQPQDTPTAELRSVSDRLMIGTNSALSLDAGAALQAAIDGQIGFLPVGIAIDDGAGHPRPLLSKPDPTRPMVRIGIAGPGPWVSLADLLSGDPARASITAEANVGLNPLTAGVAATLGGTELASGTVTVTWNDLSQLSGPNGPQVSGDAAFNSGLLRFAEGVTDPVQMATLLLGGVRDGAAAVAQAARENEQLARSLPIVGAGYDDIVAGFSAVSAAADQLLTLHRKMTVAQFETALEGVVAEAFGLSPEAVAPVISLELDASQPRTALVLHLDLCRASTAERGCNSVRPINGTFSIDADGLGVVGATGTTALALDYLASLRLDLGVELPEVLAGTSEAPEPAPAPGQSAPSLFVLGSSGAVADLQATVDLNTSADGTFRAFVGPYTASLGVRGTVAGASFEDPAQASASVRFVVGSAGPSDERLAPQEWLAKVIANLGANGVTDHSEAWTPATCPVAGQEGCATLPIYLKTAGGDVQTSDGSRWAKLGDAPISWTATRLADPTTYSADVPDSIAADLHARALSFTSVVQGFRFLVVQAKAGLDGANVGQDLPVLGKAFTAGSNALGELDAAAAKVEGLAATLDTVATAGALTNSVKTWFVTNLGPSSQLKLLRDTNGDGAVNAADVTIVVYCGEVVCAAGASLVDATDVELDVAIGKLSTATAPKFDFGIPGMRISSEATTSATAGWRLELHGGVDRNGFYLDPATVSGTPELTLDATAALPAQIEATMAGLPIRMTDATPGANDLSLQLGVDLLGPEKLRLGEMVQRGADMLDQQHLALTARGCADLQLGFAVRVPGNTAQALPGITGELALHADWNGCPGSSGEAVDIRDGLSPVASLQMRNIRLDAGTTATNMIRPVVNEIQRVTRPFEPVVRTVTQPIPVISDLAEFIGEDPITWFDAWAASQEFSGNDVTAIRTLVNLTNFANNFPNSPTMSVKIADDVTIDLTNGQLMFADPDQAFEQLISGVPQIHDVLGELEQGGWTLQSRIDDVAGDSREAEFSFPAFEEPIQFLQMLFGKDIDLARFDAGTLRAEAGFDLPFGLPFAKVGVRGNASIEGHFAVSYDTAGIREAIATRPISWSSLGSLVHGLGIDDLDANGNDVPEIRLEASLDLYAYVGIPGLSAQAYGGVEGDLDINLRDPDGDGKIRFREVKARLRNPLCLFDTSGSIDVFARVKVETPFGDAMKEIVDPYTLYEFPNISDWCDQQEAGGGAGFEMPVPVLAEQVGSSLYLNAGTRAASRKMGGDGDETFLVTDLGYGKVEVSGYGFTQQYGITTGIRVVNATTGEGNDEVTLQERAVPTDTKDIPVTLTVQGGPGDDLINGGSANDSLDGGAGSDLINGRGGRDTLTGGDGNDMLRGGAEGDTILGDVGSNPGDDVIDGGAGDDLLRPMNGRDVVLGGLGNDTVDGEFNSGVTGLATGPDRIEGGDGADSLNGSSSGDLIIGGLDAEPTTVTEWDRLDGKGGDDCIVADAGTGAVNPDGSVGCTPFPGEAERDNVRGGVGADTIYGQAGNDYLDGDDQSNGDTSPDHIDGGLGDDDLLGAGGNDHLIGGEGLDDLRGEGGDDLLEGNAGNDELRGAEGSDVLIGDLGDDLMYGFAAANPNAPDGDDGLDGGPGNDTLWGGAANDRLSGGEGIDALSSEAGDDQADGGPGNDTVDGGDGNDRLFGAEGNDKVLGQGGNDALDGGPGNDSLVGDVTSLSALNPPAWPDGSPKYQISTNLTVAGVDTFVGGGGKDVAWDTQLDPPSSASRNGLTLTVSKPLGSGITNGSATSYTYLQTAQGNVEMLFTLKNASGTVVNTGRFSVSALANRPPIAVADQVTTAQGVAYRGGVLGNDSDPDGNQLSVTPASGSTTGGTFTVDAAGVFVYTPAVTFTGPTDSFTYAVTDGFGGTATATVSITISGDVVAPTYGCEQPTGWSPVEVTVTCWATDTGVGLADEADAARPYRTAVGAGNEGAATIDPWSVCDATGNCADVEPFEVRVDRKAPAVTSANDGRTYAFGTAISKDVRCSDSGAGLAEGTCAGLGEALDASIGTHSFTVEATDAVGNATTATINYTVTPPVNGAPLANDDLVAVIQGQGVSLNVLGNDRDPDGETITVIPSSGITTHGGQWSLTADGQFAYDADPGFSGPTDSVTYTVTDGSHTAAARVVISVLADVTAPAVSCTAPQGWQAGEATVACTGADLESGLSTPSQASFELISAVGAGQERPALLDPPAVCDRARNCTDLPAIEVFVDRKAPTIGSTNDAATYTVGQVITRSIVCTDGGSGLAPGTCAGQGTPLDTATPGAKTFTVTAADVAGNTSTRAVGYTVQAAGPVVELGDASVAEGRRGTVKLKLPVTVTPLPGRGEAKVIVTVRITAGSATAGVDFVQPADTVLSFGTKAKETKYVLVEVNGDKTVEADETVTATIVAVTGGTGIVSSSTGTILNDD